MLDIPSLTNEAPTEIADALFIKHEKRNNLGIDNGTKGTY